MALDEPDVKRSADGKRRLTAPDDVPLTENATIR